MKLAPSAARKLIADVEVIKQAIAVNDLITESEAAKILEITKERLQVKVMNGDVPESFYTKVAINKKKVKRFYYRSRLMGL